MDKNKIIFLGTAGDEEVAGKGQLRSGGIILQLEGNQFHLDPGPGSTARMYQNKVHPRETIAIICTNNSLLRSNDVNATISAMTLGGLDKHGVLLASKSVIKGRTNEAGEEIEPPILRKKYEHQVEGLLSFNPGNRVGVNSINIMPISAKQTDETAVSLLFTIPGNKIGYTGDTAYNEEMAKEFLGANIIIINMKNPKTIVEKGAMNTEDAKKLILRTKPRLAILTGFGARLLKEDLLQIGREIQREAEKTTVTIAKDGAEINIDDYSDRIKQTTIKGYEPQE